ncbi:putative ABC transport system permease protein [Catenulispora sp. MAP5-51]|uniref:ABC transporter permease n=1 Tax=Catenulispora sp. MAP5-51 TaxID=3156298 RepID=UPI003516D258
MLKASWRNFFAHKGRLALSLIAVVLSVAFVAGTLMFTDTIDKTFDRMFGDTAANVTVLPVKDKDAAEGAKDQTVPGSLVSQVSSVPGVASARGDVSTMQIAVTDMADNQITGDGGAPAVGINWDDQSKSVALKSGHTPSGADQVVIDEDTANNEHLKIGDELKVTALPGNFTTNIVGIAHFKTVNAGLMMVFFDDATATTKLLGAPNIYNDVAVTAAAGVSNDQLKKNVVSAIGGGYDVKTAAEQTKSTIDNLSFISVMRIALLGFAGIAVLVGAFLIVNTFQMLVAQRTRELGLLRALGASRKQINRSVRFEALLLGIIGSTLGIGAGVGIAFGLIKLLDSAGVNVSTGDMTIKVTTPIAGYAVGVIVTLVAAWLPARRAAKITPMAALRDAGTPGDRKSSVVRNTVGLIVTGAGALALFAAGSSSGNAGGSLLALGVLLTLIGAVVIGPMLAGGVVRALGALIPGTVGRLAKRNALRNPRRTGATAAALMIGLALVAGLSVVSSSMVASASSQLDKSVGADFVMQTQGRLGVTPEALAAAKSTRGIAHVTENKDISGKIGDAGARSDFFVSSSTMLDDFSVKTVSGDMSKVFSGDGIAVQEDFASSHHLKLGDTTPVTFDGGSPTNLSIVAITSKDTSFNNGRSYVSSDTVAKSVPAAKMPLDFMLFAKAEPGQADAAYKALQDNLKPFPQIQVKNQADYKKLLHDQVGQLLGLVYGLLGLAIIVAILGVVNTLALSVVERTREIGLLRAIGLSRRRLRRMIRLESVVIALFGAVLGVGLGMGWGIAAQKLLSSAGLGILSIPWATIVVVFIGSAVVGLLAALMPAWRASRQNVLAAIATD